MKIAVISTVRGYSWAGSEELWYLTAMLGLGKGDHIQVCLNKDLLSSQQVSTLIEKGARASAWKERRLARLERFQEAISPNFTLSKLGHPDLILVSLGSLPSMTYVPGLSRLLLDSGLPFVLLTQFHADCLPVMPQERKVISAVLAAAEKCVFVSEHNLNLAERQFGLDLSKGAVVYNPIRTQLAEPIPFPKDQGSVHFATVARFECLWKAQDILVDIFAEAFWRERPVSLKLYGEGPDRDYVEGLIRRRNLEDTVHVPGYSRDLAGIWKDASVMLLPSRGEGTPLAVLEAMMFGRVVITTNVGGNGEVITDGVDGYLAEAATPASFNRTMRRAWEERERWPEVGRKAHETAKKFAVLDPAGILLELLHEVANGGNR